MGIEPTRAAPLGLENKQFGAMADPKCDGRVNFGVMWGHVGIRRREKAGLGLNIRGFLASSRGSRAPPVRRRVSWCEARDRVRLLQHQRDARDEDAGAVPAEERSASPLGYRNACSEADVHASFVC